jgi:hypothetical protein
VLSLLEATALLDAQGPYERTQCAQVIFTPVLLGVGHRDAFLKADRDRIVNDLTCAVVIA